MYCQHIKLSVKRGADHYEVDEALDSIQQILKDPSLKLYANEVTTTVETLTGLPKRYQAAAEKLIQRIKELQR